MNSAGRTIAEHTASRTLLSFAAFVIVIAGLKASAAILIPFLLAVFIAIVLAPALRWLQGHGFPQGVALCLIISLLIMLGLLFAALLGTSLEAFSRALPQYQQRLREGAGLILQWLAGNGVVVSREVALEYLDPGKVMRLVAGLLGSLGSVLTNGFLILITVIFLLTELTALPAKWRLAFKRPGKSFERATAVAASINRYMAIKTLFSLLTAVLVSLWLFWLGVDFPLLWGVLAFALNFVPNIGSIIAAVPAVMLAMIQLGPLSAMFVALGYVVINILVGTIIEPRYMGRGLGLSTLVVFLSLVFWGWVLGPVGMLLSVPLTITAKIALESNDRTHWMAVMLGPSPIPDKS